jgi:hypothetical protein
MSIPGEGHEDVGESQQQNRGHGDILPYLELRL